MLRGIYGDPERYVKQYWNRWSKDLYFTGDGAKRDQDGYFWLLGRVDDVINVAGHRIGTMEVESALVDHPRVAEAAVVGRAHEMKGQAISAFVTLKEGSSGEMLIDELKDHVVKKIALTTSSSPPTCRRPAPEKSCVASSATSPKARRSATRRRSQIPR
jgi:acetyl-CoA synthetase